ncbi:MAG: tubulin-like doman-containing protein [Pirellulaceae bacterium]
MSVIAARTDEPIPGYRVIQRIGAGGYGEVWTAQAPGDLTKAIKFVYGLLDEDRAARELKALNRIKGVRHPFLLSLERIEVVDGQLLIVTELAECSLKDRFEVCRKAGQTGIPREELLKYLTDTADALDYMSEQHSLQHLDVKPENLLLLGGRIKVADFGLVKDIHDHTASMMGGLTPVYAPPEVFEGRPSRRSDQYSLAIVYQEMLTGVVPFPGRTAAQLAAQHLNAKPRLTSLPPEDQPLVLRALAKKPNDRFNSCRELVDALASVGRRAGTSAAAGGLSKPASDQKSVALGATQAAGNLVPATQPGLPTSSGATSSGATSSGATSALSATAPRTPAEMLQHLESVSQAIDTAATGSFAPSPRMTHHTSSGPIVPDMSAVGGDGDSFQAPMLADLGEPPPVVDLPPLAVDLSQWQPRPTLFLGIGGTGARVLARLERRLADRLVGAARECFPMLVLDSDQRDLTSVTHTPGLQLRPEETLALPLRKTQDYREDSRKILEWLSRRWLYNIPRSQLTEGMRPLGRLALVDHADQAFGRIKGTVQRLVKSLGPSQPAPRVVIVASIGGGTGGGMITDIAFAARQILDELNQPEAEVLLLLAHCTNRNPQQQELSAVNAVATLTELQHYHRSPFPGDPACKLKERSIAKPAIDDAYLVHLGEELAPEQYEAACDKVSEFLLLDSVTLAAASLEAARHQPREATQGLRVRTFGLCQIGFAHDHLVEIAVKRVARNVVERWQGAPRRNDPKQSIRLIPKAGIAQIEPQAGSTQAQVEAQAGAIVEQLHLEIDPLMKIVQEMAAEEMGGNPDAFFRTFLSGGAQMADRAAIERWFTSANEVFGSRPNDSGAKVTPAKLLLALEERVARLIQQAGMAMRQSIEILVDDPALRVHGTQRVAKALQAHLKLLCDKLRDARVRLLNESHALQQQLLTSLPDPKGKSKGPRRSPAELQTLFFQDCRLRLFELGAQIAANIAHSLQSHAVCAHDSLVDLARELHHLAVQLATDELIEDEQEDEQHVSSADNLAPLRAMVGEQLRGADEAIAALLDRQMSASVLSPAGGLRPAIAAGGQQREVLVAQLHTAARQAVLGRLATIDIAGSALAGQSEEHPLGRCLAGAQPRLLACGGNRRLLCVVPAEAAQSLTPEVLATQIGPGEFGQLPTVVPDASGDVVLLFEMGEMSIKHAAAALIDHRRDLAELAARLHTRSDVTWTPLLG